MKASVQQGSEEVGRGFWNDFWFGRDVRGWTYLDQRIFEVLEQEITPRNPKEIFSGLRVLEAGCGTGGISRLLVENGADITLLDISEKAIVLARKGFGELGARVKVSQSSVFAIPHPGGAFDLVWNAGVIEHFDRHLQIQAISEMSRVCRPGGRVILLNPYQRSYLYRVGKYLLEKTNLWPFGYEEPVGTLIEVANEVSGVRLREEYSVAFLHILIGAFALIPGLALVTRGLNRAAEFLYQYALGRGLAWADRLLSRAFGGYLLVSVFEKQ